MNQLDNVVLSVVKDFVKAGKLFTALDVSNTVKNTLPFARHREVRDLVRSLFSSEIETAGYARTPIRVTLVDGSVADALLYHPLADSWDLDNKYDVQQRAQTSSLPVGKNIPNAPIMNTPAPTVIANSAVSPPVPQPLSNKDLWDSLFQTQKSIFPNR